MSQITIQCHLVARASTRQQLWLLMAQKNTPLINKLLQQVGQHPDFETWRQKGKLQVGIVKALCQALKTEERFIGQPARFYSSAIAVVDYIYRAWLALQKRLQYQLEGQTRWYQMLKSDAELIEICGGSLETLRSKAAEILAQLAPESASVNPPTTKGKKSKKRKNSSNNPNLSAALFEAYRQTEDILSSCAINYLLKNGCKVSEKEEAPEKFAKRRRSVEIRIERLNQQLVKCPRVGI